MFKYLTNRLVQITIIITLVIGASFIFNGCEKDVFDNSNALEMRNDSISGNLQGLENEFFQWFITSKNEVNVNDSIITPFYFDIDWSSGTQYDGFGSNSFVYNVIYSPFDTTSYIRNQIVFTKQNNQEYFAKILTYIADSNYYNENMMIPSYSEFTGFVIESSSTLNLYEKVYAVYQGDIVDIYYGNMLSYRNDPDNGCFGNGGNYFVNLFNLFGSWLDALNPFSWDWGGGDDGNWSWGDWTNWNSGGGSGDNGSSGGGGFFGENGGKWPKWTELQYIKHQDCIKTNVELYTGVLGISWIDNLTSPCIEGDGKEMIESYMSFYCYITGDEIWEMRNDGDWHSFHNRILLKTSSDCRLCEVAIEKFKKKYGIDDLTEEQEILIFDVV